MTQGVGSQGGHPAGGRCGPLVTTALLWGLLPIPQGLPFPLSTLEVSAGQGRCLGWVEVLKVCAWGGGFQVFPLGRLREKADLREDGERVRGGGLEKSSSGPPHSAPPSHNNPPSPTPPPTHDIP